MIYSFAVYVIYATYLSEHMCMIFYVKKMKGTITSVILNKIPLI